MSAVHWPDHLLTLEEWADLPQDESLRYELVEGVLSVVPRPAPLHQRVMYRLTFQLNGQLPDELEAVQDTEIVVEAAHPATVRAPDVVVTHTRVVEANPARLDATDVVLAVEIISPGTKRTDQVTKFAEYAEAGIEHYWLIDLDSPLTVTAYQLIDGEYEIIADSEEPFTVTAPVELKIDPATLATRR
ncbi:Uma2 family endonuclease [Qaidamihabitans albus]|uniref:Uma2 family endonuclease n=1 Tax=Qaidamihabitans albus TaxID=2795733 RepID=UPI0018F146CB|nr:Uma2 family endonuclease [Qaidamihabitans albus]